jgi:hypothetical protein
MCLTHGLQLNSRGRKKLALLPTKSLSDNKVSGISSILIIINATSSPFLAQKQKLKGTKDMIEIMYSSEIKIRL